MNAGKPKDYINMFLEEQKSWLRSQLTLDVPQPEELARRDDFLAKLKRDNYYWYAGPARHFA